ncbi:MATE family efflux transporter [Helicobacter cetorum]|uniref:MATE family efflux transporter n=1 Tax=Helicobacter cetorum TaxID=138563 RepID=UPI000CF06053|nr:MATE family efflux transporter [Helicobacter cetorum]
MPSGVNAFLDVFVIALSVFFMGKLSHHHIVALGVGLQFLMLFYGVNTILYTGTNAQLSRLVGARDFSQINLAFSSIVIGGAFVCLGVLIFSYILIEPFLLWINLDKESCELTQIYLKTLVFALPAIFLKNIFVSALASFLDTLTPFVVKLIMVILCVFLNQALIFGDFGFKEMGIVGSALANVIVSYLELFLLAFFLQFKKSSLRFTFQFDNSFLKNTFRIGWPAGFERFLTLCSLMVIAKFIASYGDKVLAGMQVGIRVETFSFMPGFGFMIASMVLVGQNLGANKTELAQDYAYLILKISMVLMGIIGILMAIFAREFASLFSHDKEVIEVARYYLIAVGLSQAPLIGYFVLDGVFRGASITKVSLYINTLSLWGLRIIPMYLLVLYHFEVEFIFGVIAIETYLRALVYYKVFSKGVWKRPGKRA